MLNCRLDGPSYSEVRWSTDIACMHALVATVPQLLCEFAQLVCLYRCSRSIRYSDGFVYTDLVESIVK